MHVLAAINSLGTGGAERVLTTLANEWIACDVAVTLVTLADPYANCAYPLRPEVRLTPHRESGRRLTKYARRALGLRRIIRDCSPDAVISFTYSANVVAIMAGLDLGAPLIISERNNIARKTMSRGWGTVIRFMYPHADALVVQTSAAEQALPFAHPNVYVIPNPVLMHPVAPAVRNASGNFHVMAMGRLVHQKGFDLLLCAFASLHALMPHARLTIWGEGPERDRLAALRNTLGIEAAVSLPGTTQNPGAALADADAFVLSSRYEGFPNVLCEAMALGLPVVSTRCEFGPEAIVRDGIDGLLVEPESPASLFAGMLRLAEDQRLRARIASEAVQIRTRLNAAAIAAEWLKLIKSLRAPG